MQPLLRATKNAPTLIGNQLNINDSSASAEPFARDTRCSRRYV
jgi:hypothetical protein